MTGAERAVRLDAEDHRMVRLESVDDDLTQARLDAEERIATTGCRTDDERAAALKRLKQERTERAWMEKFRQQRFNEANARADGAGDAPEAARLAAERRINEAWRPRRS
jgi:hypothetical protein